MTEPRKKIMVNQDVLEDAEFTCVNDAEIIVEIECSIFLTLTRKLTTKICTKKKIETIGSTNSHCSSKHFTIFNFTTSCSNILGSPSGKNPAHGSGTCRTKASVALVKMFDFLIPPHQYQNKQVNRYKYFNM